MAYTDKQKANLRPFGSMTPEEQAALSRKGSAAAKEARARNKTFKEAVNWALDLPAMSGNADVEKIRQRFPDITNRDAVAISLAAEAIKKRDVRAFIALRDTTGELPEQTVNVKNEQPMTITVKTVD